VLPSLLTVGCEGGVDLGIDVDYDTDGEAAWDERDEPEAEGDEDEGGVNKFVLTTIFEKSNTGGKLGSIGPGPMIGGLFTFPLEV
jgi:hypothetical protein